MKQRETQPSVAHVSFRLFLSREASLSSELDVQCCVSVLRFLRHPFWLFLMSNVTM
jgi:hypothetical protein